MKQLLTREIKKCRIKIQKSRNTGKDYKYLKQKADLESYEKEISLYLKEVLHDI